MFKRLFAALLEPQRHGRLQRIDVRLVLDVLGKQVLRPLLPIAERLCRTLGA